MINRRHNRHLAIVHALRSREWSPAAALAQRFQVTSRTIYRDIEELISAGVPIQSIPGPDGGYRLASDQPLTPLTLDADEALKLYVVSLLDRQKIDTHAESLDNSNGSRVGPPTYSREVLKRLSQRIFFDTADWYWKDEGSGHLPPIYQALMTSTALTLTTRPPGHDLQTTMIVKPYGVVWKSGEWYLIGTPIGQDAQRYRLNLVDHLAVTDLHFTYPNDFQLREWWAREIEEYGKGTTRVVLEVAASARDELLRLTLKSNSEVTYTPTGGLHICLYVDRWEWLIPLVASYGGDVIVTEPPQLRTGVINHIRRALSAYLQPTQADPPESAGFHNDDSRLRSTRGRA